MKRIFAVSAITVLLASLVLMPYPVRAAAEVWVDDDWDGLIAGTVVDGHTIGTDAFATIQDGIDAADETGTVNVAAGTYDENIIISAKPGIKILGAGAAVTTINGDIDGDNVGDGSVVTGNNMNADSKIEGFTITGGVAPSPTPGRGGGLYLESSATTISSCNITGNSAIYGGGIYISNTLVGSKSPKVINCLVKDNGASAMGGGIFFYGATLSPTIMNSTIADNTGGDGIYNIQASTTITNTIVYGNSASDATNSGGTINISNSLIGTGTDPKFVGSGDYHLQSGSPAIDTGTSTGAPGNDLDGVFRPQGIGVDIGAFEYMLAVNYTLNLTIVGNGTVALDLAGPTYPSGTVVTLTANPGTGYVFDSWSGDLAGSTNPETITMDGDKSVIATFTESSQDKDTFQNFKISRMTINWAKDITKPDKKWGWRSFFSWFMRFTTKNADKFSISGRIKLPEGYTVAHLEESATVSVAINNSSGSDAVNFKEQILRRLGVRWTDTGKSPGENMKITKMTIWWAPEERDLAGWAGFNIRGELEFPESIGVNTTLAEATVTLTIPVSAGSGGGSLPGEEMVEFQVYSRSNQWSYYNSSLPFFRYEH